MTTMVRALLCLVVVAACGAPLPSRAPEAAQARRCERTATTGEPKTPRPLRSFAGFASCDVRVVESTVAAQCGRVLLLYSEVDGTVALERVRRLVARITERFPRAATISEGTRSLRAVQHASLTAVPAKPLPIAVKAEVIVVQESARARVVGCAELAGNQCETAFEPTLVEGASVLAAARAEGMIAPALDPLARYRALPLKTGGRSESYELSADVPRHVERVILDGIPAGSPVDLVFVVDTTGSMTDDIDAVKRDLHAIHAALAQKTTDYRIGVVAYRDCGDEYVARTMLAASPDHEGVDRAIEALAVSGGGDMPEHVYAGLEHALLEQPFRPNASHHILALGDAPAHEDYRDAPSEASVLALAAKRDVHIHTVLVSCDSLCRGFLRVMR